LWLREYGSLSKKRSQVFESMIKSGDADNRRLGAILLETEERDNRIHQSKQKLTSKSQYALGALLAIYLLNGFFLGPIVWNLAFGYKPELASWQFFLISLGPILLIWLLITGLLWVFHRRRCAAINDDYLDQIYFTTSSNTEKLRIIRERVAKLGGEEAPERSSGSESQ
jgi:energy-coupling factor transporter transmembrane protein EcfT